MWARYALAAVAAVSLTGCISNPGYRPCGPGFMNNMLVPQGCAGVDFRRACQRHDDCYASGCDRKACDDRFYNDMLRTCDCSPFPGLCKLRACQWYVQVRLFGGIGYDQGGSGCGSPGCQRCQSHRCCPQCNGCAPACSEQQAWEQPVLEQPVE